MSSTKTGFSGLCKKLLPRRNKRTLEVTVEKPPFSLSATSVSSSPCSRWSSSEISEERDYSGEIERVFRYIDEDGDGKISPSELRRCVKAVGVQKLTAEEAEAAVESSDSDGDGMLSLADFERLMGGDGVTEEEKKEELKTAFSMYSETNKRNGNGGIITPKSLKRMLSRLGESKSVQDCKAMIRVYDLNGDGVLSFDEFVVMMG